MSEKNSIFGESPQINPFLNPSKNGQTSIRSPFGSNGEKSSIFVANNQKKDEVVKSGGLFSSDQTSKNKQEGSFFGSFSLGNNPDKSEK